MKTKIYLEDWSFNAGIIGFIKILENANDDFTQKKSNYIEFDTEKLENFSTYYFKYFIEKYNIANSLQERIEKSIEKIKSHLKSLQTNDKSSNKEIQTKIKNEKNTLKKIIKPQLDKINKIDEQVYIKMIESYNQIDTIKQKEDICKLEEIKKVILECSFEKSINDKNTWNKVRSIIGNTYFGQASFLQKTRANLSIDKQEELMYRDYISNIIELDFLESILQDEYEIKEIKEHINLKQKEKLITKEIEKAYNNIFKMIEKGKGIQEVKKYIQTNVFSTCHMCGNSNCITEEYSEKHFAPLAVSSENMKNFFWNQNVKLPICDMCKLILFCTPAGITPINKIIKQYDKGKYIYKEKEISSFVNYDTSVQELLQRNKDFSNMSKANKSIENPYTDLILNIIDQEKKISYWQLQNIFVAEFETEYGAFSRIEYFNISKYVAKFLKEYSEKTLNKILDYRFRLQIIDYILKDRDLSYMINDRLQEELKKEVKNGYNIYLLAKIRLILNLLKKEEKNMEDEIKKQNNKLKVLYNLGVQIHEELKAKGEDNRLTGYEYKMLNSLKSGNKQEFMDTVIRIHMSMGKDVSQIFLEVMQEGNLDFQSIGHSFISGLISNKYNKKEEDK